MQLNTRNFLLYALSVAFLLIAITLTVVSDVTNERVAHSSLAVFSSQEAAVLTAIQVEPTPTLDREKNLAALREKIAGLDFSPFTATEIVTEPETTLTSAITVPSDVISCSAPVAQEVRWPARGVKFEVVEGARIVYLDTGVRSDVLSGDPLATTSATREVLLQLPLHSSPLSSKSCTVSDVVGVALDGSLIRNTEYAVYGIFGSESLIGYALDGFPMYGLSDDVLDQCGGKSVDGQYGYYLRPDQTVVLDCFFGKPVGL